MELRHLRYVIAASERGSFRGAAVALGVRQSTVSRAISDLEDEMGAALFLRSHAGVVLTYAGQRYVRQALDVLRQLSQVSTEVGQIGRGRQGIVRIGLLSCLSSGFLAELLEAYARVHTDVRLTFCEGAASDQLPAICNHQLDVAFLAGLPQAPDTCEVAHLWDERIFIAMSNTDCLVKQEEIGWEDARNRTFVVNDSLIGPEFQLRLARHLGCTGHPRIEHHAVHQDTLIQIASISSKLTLVNEATVAMRPPGVTFRPLVGEILPFCAVWSVQNDNPAFRCLLSLAKAISKQCFLLPT